MSEENEGNKPEDSMEEIKFTEETSELTPYQKGFDHVESMLSQAINLSNDKRMHEPTCPICNSPLRTDVEDMWDKTPGNRITKPIQDFLKERTGLKVSAEVVRHHMKNHKDSGDREIRKVEFVDRVRRLYGNGSATTLDQIQLCLAIITDRIMEMNTIAPDHDHTVAEIEKVKNAEINRLMKTYGDFMKLRATVLGEMRDSGDIISIARKKFIDVFNTAIIEAENDREREIIQKILEGLKG